MELKELTNNEEQIMDMISKQIKERRTQVKYSMEAMAEKLEMEKSTYSKKEKNPRRFKLIEIYKLMLILGIEDPFFSKEIGCKKTCVECT